jgi:hypothetical protein
MAKAIKTINIPSGNSGRLAKGSVRVSGDGVTLADTNTAQTLTNKTFTAPVSTNAVVNTPTMYFTVATIAGAGTAITDANTITSVSPAIILMTGGNNSVGVKLPVAVAGAHYILKNDDAANGIMKVYPQVNSTINSTANTAMSMAANTMAEFYALNATTWLTVKTPA